MTRLEKTIEIVFRLIPAAALFSMFFALDGGLRWMGLFGFLPLLLWAKGCPSCAVRGDDRPPPNFPCY